MLSIAIYIKYNIIYIIVILNIIFSINSTKIDSLVILTDFSDAFHNYSFSVKVIELHCCSKYSRI